MEKIKVYLIGQTLSTNNSEAFSLYRKSKFGEIFGDKIQYSLAESLYLLEKGKIEVIQKNKKLNFENLISKLKKYDSRIHLKYPIFKDLREKGYLVKTALKFGADFRVYEKGAKIDKEHAKWIVFVEHETKTLKWHEFSAKNRVAHSTNKKLLLAILDEEFKPTYYEIKWIKI